MAAIPPIAYVSAASKVLVLTAGLRYGRRLPPARRWIFAWALIGLLIDGAMLVYALRKQNNHWMSYVAAPVEVSTLLFALSCWHLDRGRQILRTLAVAFVATVVVLVVFVESLTTFSLVRGPIESILIVAASLATLLLLLRDEQGNLFQRDWFWICAGLSLRYGALATLGFLIAYAKYRIAPLSVFAFPLIFIMTFIANLVYDPSSSIPQVLSQELFRQAHGIAE